MILQILLYEKDIYHTFIVTLLFLVPEDDWNIEAIWRHTLELEEKS